MAVKSAARPLSAWSVVRFVGALAAVLALAGCDDGRETRAKRAEPFDLPAGQCVGLLTERRASFEPLDPVDGENACGIANPVRLSALTAALSRPVTLGCPLAVRVDDFERRILQPLAIRYFGQPVRRIHHYGAYACRNQRGGNANQISQHALGRAIDISAFELLDGTLIRVKQDWNGVGRRSRFLRNVAREACGLFHVVLTPSHDRAHHDHLHFDTGPWRLCAT